MEEVTKEEVIGTGALKGLYSPFTLMSDSQELGRLFQDGFFNWIGQGVVQPRTERPPFLAPQAPGIPVPPHVSLQP
jgi:hypothetical protein